MKQQEIKKKEWTIMVYMAGDNNLAVDMAYAMEQIRELAVAGADSLNLFVYYDGNSPEIPTLYCDFTDPHDPKYFRSFLVGDKLFKNVPKKANENAADKYSVINFVDWCVNKVEVETNGEISRGRRAKRYALIFSGHSLGFQDIGLFRDETSGKSMKMGDLFMALQRIVSPKWALDDFVAANDRGEKEDSKEDPGAVFGVSKEAAHFLLDETDLLLGQPLDILGFDSCVMGMLEVGYQFCDVAKTMIVSEGSVPSAGWTYAKILGGIARGQHGKSSAKLVAEHFVKEFIRSQDRFTVGGSSVDMAAWDMSKFRQLTEALNGLSSALIECFRDEGTIHRQMERVILQVHWKCQSYMFDQNVDLGDFCSQLDRECELVAGEISGETDLLSRVQDACREVLRELKRAVILSGFSGGGYQYSNGISVFFPWSLEAYNASKKNYEALFIARDIKQSNQDSEIKTLFWNDFLKKYLNEVARRKSEDLTEHVRPGNKIRYESGIRFSDRSDPVAAGSQSSEITGSQSSKIAGSQSSKIAGSQSSKIAGSQSSKIAGSQSSKIAGSQSSKMGGGSNAFFNTLQLWKNIESPWNVSGFTRKPEEDELEAGNGDA